MLCCMYSTHSHFVHEPMTQLAGLEVCHLSVTASNWWNRVKWAIKSVCVSCVGQSHCLWLRSLIVNRTKRKKSFTLTAVSHSVQFLLLTWRRNLSVHDLKSSHIPCFQGKLLDKGKGVKRKKKYHAIFFFHYNMDTMVHSSGRSQC